MASIDLLILVLLLVSAFLTLVQYFAWRTLGRQLHALLWTACFAAATVQWAGNLLFPIFIPGSVFGWILLSGLAMSTAIFSTLGHRFRKGIHERWLHFVAAGLAATALVAVTSTIVPHRGLTVAITPLFAGLVIPFAAAALLPRQGGSHPERALAAILGLFTIFELCVGAIALLAGRDGDPFYLNLYSHILFLGLPALFAGSGLFTIFLQGADLSAELKRQSMTDPLTSVLNRRGLSEAANRAIQESRSKDRELSVFVADIDHFKSVNDRFGHDAGDRVLQQFAALLRNLVGNQGIVGRLGGEEFAVLLPGTSSTAALDLAEAVRKGTLTLKVAAPSSIATITASFGIAAFVSGDEGFSDLLNRADAALYQSKRSGRDRSTVADPDDQIRSAA